MDKSSIVTRAAAIKRLFNSPWQKEEEQSGGYVRWWKVEGPKDSSGNRKQYPPVRSKYTTAVLWAVSQPDFTIYNNDGTIELYIPDNAIVIDGFNDHSILSVISEGLMYPNNAITAGKYHK